MASVSATGNQNKNEVSIADFAHPQYTAMSGRWVQMNDFYNALVKQKDDNTNKKKSYLPMTGGQLLDTKTGQIRYEAYLTRSVYYNYTAKTVIDSKNTIVRKKASFVIPESIAYMEQTFNKDDESIYAVLEDTFEEQLKTSRVCRLLDIVIKEGKPEFRSVEYKALAFPSWQEQEVFNIDGEEINLGKRLVYALLNESCSEIGESGQYEDVKKYRVVGLRYTDEDSADMFRYYTIVLYEKEIEDLKYLTSPDRFDYEYIVNRYGDRYKEPGYFDNKYDKIPLTVINSTNLKKSVVNPILWDQSEISKALYQKNANYSEIEHQQTINTLFGKGITNDDHILVGGQYTTSDPEADLKYIGIDGSALGEVRESQNDLHSACQTFGGVEVGQKNSVESGRAMENRITVQTDRLREVSETGVAGCVNQMKFACDWMGVKKEVVGVANIDFRAETATTEDLNKMGESWRMGEISTVDFYDWQYKNGYTNFANVEKFKAELIKDKNTLSNNEEIANDSEE